MDLRHLTDNALLEDTKKLAAQERKITTKILHHLKEIENRRLFSDLRYPSLFEYCKKELLYSEASAQRRIVAARMLRDIPEIEQKIESGALSLSNIANAGKFFKEENIASIEKKRAILKEIENMSAREGEKRLFELFNKEENAAEGSKRISPEKHHVSFILTDETLELLNNVKGLLVRPLTSNELIKYMAVTTIERLNHKKFKINAA